MRAVVCERRRSHRGHGQGDVSVGPQDRPEGAVPGDIGRALRVLSGELGVPATVGGSGLGAHGLDEPGHVRDPLRSLTAPEVPGIWRGRGCRMRRAAER